MLGCAVSRPLAWLAPSVETQTVSVGLAMVPLRSWLSDAHSQAPAAVSAPISWVLMPVTVYAVLRGFPLTNKSFNLSYAGNDL